jgi:hypothetical protein
MPGLPALRLPTRCAARRFADAALPLPLVLTNASACRPPPARSTRSNHSSANRMRQHPLEKSSKTRAFEGGSTTRRSPSPGRRHRPGAGKDRGELRPSIGRAQRFASEVEPPFDTWAAQSRKLTRRRKQAPPEDLLREGRRERSRIRPHLHQNYRGLLRAQALPLSIRAVQY